MFGVIERQKRGMKMSIYMVDDKTCNECDGHLIKGHCFNENCHLFALPSLLKEIEDKNHRRNKTTDNLRNEIKELKEDIKHLDNLVGYLKEELSKSKTKENEQYREDKRQGRLEV